MILNASAAALPVKGEGEKTVVRRATLTDLPYVDSLRKKEGAALGFIPMGAYESTVSFAPVDGRHRYLTNLLLVTEDNGDLTGFCYASFDGNEAKIFQICVQEDARRWHRAPLMVDWFLRVAEGGQKQTASCRVAYDLESNFFWRAIGFIPVKMVTSTRLNQRESKSRRPLWIYKKSLGRLI